MIKIRIQNYVNVNCN